MKKYRTGSANDTLLIDEVEVSKESENSIWIDLVHYRKRADNRSYWDTREDAELYLLEKDQKRIDVLEEQLKCAELKRSATIQALLKERDK